MSSNSLKPGFLCTHWGSEQFTAGGFFKLAIDAGYHGVEINMPADAAFVAAFERELELIREGRDETFVFCAQLVPEPSIETPDDFLLRIKQRLTDLATLRPNFINSHTGKDYFSFEDNCRAIDMLTEFTSRTGIPVYHEIHRGRFTFHSAATLPYLDKYPELRLTGDFSHWCTVSESLLQDQQHIIDRVIPHVSHIHARIGFEQGPQVNDPMAPEWQEHHRIFLRWWQQIIDYRKQQGFTAVTITPEYGPAPYMPQTPFSKSPLSDQWTNNLQITQIIQDQLKF
jgi:sugar phosphate isomerase/epimerase